MSSGPQLFATPTFDVSGKLIIKAQLGDDIRKIPIHNEEITYDELLLMMQRLFRGKIQNSDDVVIKYKDSDGDLITIFDSSDVSFAKSQSRFLKLTVFVNQRPRPLEHDQIKELKSELVQMRDKMNHLLAKLDSYSEEQEMKDRLKQEVKDTRAIVGSAEKKPVTLENASMFDPLKTRKEEADTTTAAKDPFADVGVPKSSHAVISSGSYASAGSTPSNTYPQAPQNQQNLPPQSSYQPQAQMPAGPDSGNFVSQPQPYTQQPPSSYGQMIYQDKVSQQKPHAQQLPPQQNLGSQGSGLPVGYDPNQGYTQAPAPAQQQYSGGQPQPNPGDYHYGYPNRGNQDMSSPAHGSNFAPAPQNPYSMGMASKSYPQPTQGYESQFTGSMPMPPGHQGAPGMLYPH